MAGRHAVWTSQFRPSTVRAIVPGPADRMLRTEWLEHRWVPYLLALLVVAALLPYTANLVFNHADERHYRDGGALMLTTGDWLTPRTPAGEPRLKKPILPYWLSAAGMGVLGVGIAGSRIAYVLLAGGSALLVFHLALALRENRRTAALAAAIFAGHLVFLPSAVNALPDTPLLFFFTLSAIGFVHLLADDEPKRAWQWTAYLALAFAVLSKGLLPLVFLAFVVAFGFFYRAAAPGLRNLVAPAPIAVAVVIAGAWFAYQAWTNGDELMRGFVGDQVTGKVGSKPVVITLSFLSYAALLPLSFLPWTGIVAEAALFRRSSAANFAIDPRRAFMLAWTGLILVVFAFSNHWSHRYLLTAMPFAAVLLASILAGTDHAWRERTVGRYLLVIAIVWLAVMAALALMYAQLASIPAGIAYFLAGGVAVLWLAWRAVKRDQDNSVAALAAIPFVVILAMAPVVLAVTERGTAKRAAEALLARGADPSATLFVGKEKDASPIRLYLEEPTALRQVRELKAGDLDSASWTMTYDRNVAAELERQGYAVAFAPGGWRGSPQELLEAALRWELRDTLTAGNTEIFIGKRK